MSTILISRYKQETLTGADFNGKASGLGFMAAILLHIGLLLLMIFMQQHTAFNRKLPPSVRVDLVSYSPKLEDLLKSDKKQSKKVITKKPDERIKPKPVKKIIKKPVAKIVKPVKKKEKEFSEKKAPEPEEIIKAAKEDIKERVEEQEQNKIRDILSELQEKVDEQETQDDYEEEEVQESAFVGWGQNNVAESVYNGILMDSIQRLWIYNERLAQLKSNEEKIEVVIHIKILVSGDLGDIWIETKSGNSYLDSTAIRATKKAAPFPPLPKEFQRKFYVVGLRFSPEGLK
ncbi:MAG: TonB family protein [Desulfobacteraceae bacterium]|nr:TonB family protein [Desulfobacteraceae bacterium]